MKKTTKLICTVLAFVLLSLSLCACEKKPGLYTWYGAKVNAEYMLKLTLDAGEGEKVYNVPLDTYRNLFVYYASIVSDTVVGSGDVVTVTTDEQKTTVLKEYTEDELCEYYALVALAEKYGVSLTESDSELYKKDYSARIESYVSQLDEEYSKDFKGTKEEYAKYLYDKAIEKLGVTDEYLQYMYYRNLLDKRVKEALVPDLEAFVSQSYFHFKQVYIEYTKGDDAAEKKASEQINQAYTELMGGADFDEVSKKYSNNTNYAGEYYFDSYGSIVGSSSNNTVGTVAMDAVKSLKTGEVGEILTGDADEESAYFAIICREDFEHDFIYGTSNEALVMFQYPYVGATVNSVYYTVYGDLLEAYKQNMRIEPYDAKTYKLVKVNTMY